MAASTDVRRYTGSGPTGATITNLRYCTADTNDSGNPGTYPVVKPSAGINYSYAAWVALYVGATGPAGSITNIKHYGPGTSWGTGVTVKGIQTNTYAQATGTQGTTGDLSSTIYTSGTDFSTYTSGSPLSVTSAATTGTNVRYSYYVASQMALATTVSAGALSAQTNTFRYDET